MENPPYANSYLAFDHPASIDDVKTIVREARAKGKKVRVRGALHSEHGSVLPAQAGEVVIMLDRLTSFRFDESTRTATAGAGISLGGDPLAPLGPLGVNVQRAPGDSLFVQLNELGYALPVTGGISHQTLAGFVSTGAAGCSTQHSFLDAVVELSLVDGSAQLRTLARGEPDFDAALVSLGLFGILVELKLRCEPRFDIAGLRSIQSVRDGDFSLRRKADGPSVVDFLKANEYARVLWWAEPGVERFELWEAARLERVPYGPVVDRDPDVPGQDEDVPGMAMQLVARLIFDSLSNASCWQLFKRAVADVRWLLRNKPVPFVAGVRDMIVTPLITPYSLPSEDGLGIEAFHPTAHVIRSLRKKNDAEAYPYPPSSGKSKRPISEFGELNFREWRLSPLFRAFEPLSDRAAPWQDMNGFPRGHGGHLFRDSWHEGLPMDNPVHDRVLPTTFTEAWIPLERAQEALDALHAMMLEDRLAGTGTYAIELYTAKACSAWLSMTGGQDVFRIDPFWFDDGDYAGREQFLARFWRVLRPFEMRLHWGKALPQVTGEHDPEVAERERLYPRLAAFREKRRSYDPDDLFLTDYWRVRLGITP